MSVPHYYLMPRRQRRRERMDGKRVNGWGGLDWCTHIFYITSDRYRQTVSQTDKTEYWCRAVYVLAGCFRRNITITQSWSAWARKRKKKKGGSNCNDFQQYWMITAVSLVVFPFTRGGGGGGEERTAGTDRKHRHRKRGPHTSRQ